MSLSQDFDQNSAFFVKVVNKKKKGSGTEQPVGSKKDKNKEKQTTQSKGNDEEVSCPINDQNSETSNSAQPFNGAVVECC